MDTSSLKSSRRSIRLKGYDYSRNGAYFITICLQNRECLFGTIKDGEMVLNGAGKMVQNIWDEISKYYVGIEIDIFQIMPNHIHGIIFIVGAGPVPARIISSILMMKQTGNHRGLPLRDYRCRMWYIGLKH